jgi:hypothetical protein
MVVMAACKAELGDLNQVERTVGLHRSFLAKGAKNVLVSLWVVSAETTSRLLEALVAVEVILPRKVCHGLEEFAGSTLPPNFPCRGPLPDAALIRMMGSVVSTHLRRGSEHQIASN